MVVKMKQIQPDGMCEFRTFSMAYPSERNKKTLRSMQFDIDSLEQTAPQRQRPNLEGARDYQDAFSGDPKPDAHSNGVDYVSVASMARCEPKLDFTKASSLVRNGTVKPDKILNGRGHFAVGKSAQTAFAKLKSLAALKK